MLIAIVKILIVIAKRVIAMVNRLIAMAKILIITVGGDIYWLVLSVVCLLFRSINALFPKLSPRDLQSFPHF
ncbi:hypothetical protein CQP30_16075 [Yersinia pestis]|nr:hypothetical protein A1122_08120 [Yersinia pestis A1122]ANW15477.1 hypothetical protein BAY22_16640 [Yersinia pestis]AXY34498.1 hypothetical protein CEQ20_14585 [Yersinia pseudotuberculosis]EKS44009.1 hypothetical protein INS_18406 [Yersinia pestis INS]ERP79866.1 hypothetical protein L328_17620 [Yersinia pestis 24H]ERP79995.1 hypothetical protein L327_17685 [Yersinia pestis S3]ERP80995.1 hypothetical protein L326_17530 [Yersinia pestis 113]ERP84793.1 hypothetical protein L325_17615 [Yersi